LLPVIVPQLWIVRHHYAFDFMGAIKDIVDLAKDLESRAKDRRDMDIIHKIQSLAFSFQSSYADIVERDVSLVQKNADLEKQLAEAQAEDVCIHRGIEFRRGKRTLNKWLAFCPKCHAPAQESMRIRAGKRELVPAATCTANCTWCAFIDKSFDDLIAEIGV
jgi:hypothetical protein